MMELLAASQRFLQQQETVASGKGGATLKQKEPEVSVRKLKLQQLVDQTTEEECDVLTEFQIAKCYAVYEALYGSDERPPKDEDPSSDQLAAIAHMLKNGLNPLVDFAIWKNHGQRVLRRIRLTGAYFTPDGTMHRFEIL